MEDKTMKELYTKTKAMGMNRKGSSSEELLQFFIGFIMFAGGLFWLLSIVDVHTSFGMGYYIGGMRFNSGTILIPFLVGVGLLFFLDGKKMFIGVLVAAAGLLLILVSLISSVSITVRHTSALTFIFMGVLIAGGAGLVIKNAFKK